MLIVDEKRNLLIYPLVQGSNVLATFPEAKQINGNYFAVPRNLRNSQLLRHWNYPVPPVMTNYDWPHSPAIPHPYESQKLTSNFMVLHPRSFNLSDMGTGKTLATLWAADWLMQQHPGFRALIVCPLSIMERVWGKAIFENFLSRRTFEVLYGSHQKRQETFAKSKADFLVCNFDGIGLGARTRKKFELDGFSRALAERDDIRLAIIDEASGYRDASTKRHHIARYVVGTRPYLWLLTGTPTPNAPTDAFGLAKLVNNAFGKSFTTFQNETMNRVPNSNFKWVPKWGGYDQAKKLLTPAIRFAIEDVWDGPELTTQQREVALTSEQKKLMNDLKRDLVVLTQSGVTITAAHEASARQKFLQISAGMIYDANHKAHGVDAKPRIKEIEDTIEQATGKIIIFASLTSVVNMLYKILSKRWPCEKVYGGTSPSERSRIFQAFQDGLEPRILIADPGTMAHGLDLWQARTVIWATPLDGKTELYLQGIKRAHRPGQVHPVTVVQIVSNKIEREIYQRIENNTYHQWSLLKAIRDGDF